MNTISEKNDAALKDDVLAELEYEPSVRVTDIGVLVKDGTVTLNGFATNYGEKWDAVRAARRVAGVNAIADEIEVRQPDSLRHTDGDIAAAAANQIKWCPMIPSGAVTITVRKGWISLEGELEWAYQKEAVEGAVKYLAGVTGVGNLIAIRPKLAVENVGASIKRAFARNALLEADKIEVETSGNKVTLYGRVRNNSERDEAERVAWAAPGVSAVENKLKLVWGFSD